jgi:hypothetical protein
MEPMMTYNFNRLEERAKELVAEGRFHDAIAIYLFMADGDASLDGGYLGMRLGQCYEQSGDLHAAKYWYGRAVEENPTVEAYATARSRLMQISIDQLISE